MKNSLLMIFTIFTIFSTGNLYAQVNLDEPLPFGVGDRYFKSSADENVVYTIPIGLYRVSPNRINKVGKRAHAEFKMGLFQEQFRIGQRKLKQEMPNAKLRMFRATQARYIAESADIPPEFEPILHGAQAFENLMGPTHVYMDIKKNARLSWYHIFPLSGKKLLKEVFGYLEDGEMFGDHIGSIEYDFISTQAGEKRLSKTRIGIYVSESHIPTEISPPLTPLSNLNFGPQTLSTTASTRDVLPEPSRDEVPLKITDNNKSPCWDSDLEIGEICLGKAIP